MEEKKNINWGTIAGVILAILVSIPIFLWVFDIDLHLDDLYSLVTKGFYYEEDESLPDYDKVVYRGTLEKLASKEKQLLINFLTTSIWEYDHESKVGYDDVLRLECDDYIIARCGYERNFQPIYRGPKLPDNATFYGNATKYDKDFLLINRKTNEVTVFTEGGILKWMKDHYQLY